MSRSPRKTFHVDKIRVITAATTKFELTVRELRHIFKCDECLDILGGIRDPFRHADRKGAPTKAA
jgi:hypothetical protein